MQLEVYPSDEWAKASARRLRSILSSDPEARICLPTGATPKPLYAEYAANANIDESTIFLLDEFILPSGDPARCDAMLDRDLLDQLADPPARVVTWDVTGDLDDECARVESEVNDGGLRLAVVGLGMNGHVGTNEPGSSIDSRCRVVDIDPSTSQGALEYGAGHAPTRAVTMGIATLLEAAEIWLIVTGSHKANVLHQATKGPITPLVPASLLRHHKRFVVMADQEAAPFL